ncbi:hypothetical protein PVAP13_4NG075476 [Panicum virgatum]|uniref:ADP-ribosylation factor n=1 Tax=Panicum virgatum TaxID=38727 RepID=A0A8T0T328_PANVG|nr:hypothetical protein PVAP13_4NG075476 [Panicum virgatum]
MGQSLMKLFFDNSCHKEVVMLGLDAAGKTTILYRLHVGEVLSTVPTIGFNVEKVEHKNVAFTVWDVGGQDKLPGRSSWPSSRTRSCSTASSWCSPTSRT